MANNIPERPLVTEELAAFNSNGIEWLDTGKKCSETGLRLGTCHSTSNADWYSACPLPITRENGVCVNWFPGRAGKE